MRYVRFNPHHSITGKLILTFVGIAFLFVILVSGSIRHVFRSHFENNLQPHLIQYMEYVQNDIGIPASRERASALASRLNISIHIIDPIGTWSSKGNLNHQHKLDIKHSISENGIDYGIALLDGHEFFMSKVNNTTFLFDIPNLHPRHKGRGLLPIAVLLIILLLLYHFTHKIIRPIATLKEGIKRIGDGDLEHRIIVSSRDELGELAININHMADDIQNMLEAKRQLLLAISHELRSPLTRAKVSLALVDDKQNKEALHSDLNEMENLIEELLETERLSSKHSVLNMQPTNINSLISRLLDIKLYKNKLGLQYPDNDIVANIDSTRIKLMLKNLIENALRHTPTGAPSPSIALSINDQNLTIGITDYGTGIEAQHIPHITEAFYRADSSRQRETGGYGLGLYLCRVIAEAHGGTLQIKSKINEGTTVTVELPNNISKKI